MGERHEEGRMGSASANRSRHLASFLLVKLISYRVDPRIALAFATAVYPSLSDRTRCLEARVIFPAANCRREIRDRFDSRCIVLAERGLSN